MPLALGKMAEFKFIGYLAEIVGNREVKIVLENPRKLRDILRIEFPEKRSIVLINQHVENFDSLVRNGDNVVIIPIISGG